MTRARRGPTRARRCPKRLPAEPGADDQTTFHYANTDTKLGEFHVWLLCEVDPGRRHETDSEDCPAARATTRGPCHEAYHASHRRVRGIHEVYDKYQVDARDEIG